MLNKYVLLTGIACIASNLLYYLVFKNVLAFVCAAFVTAAFGTILGMSFERWNHK